MQVKPLTHLVWLDSLDLSQCGAQLESVWDGSCCSVLGSFKFLLG